MTDEQKPETHIYTPLTDSTVRLVTEEQLRIEALEKEVRDLRDMVDALQRRNSAAHMLMWRRLRKGRL
jgi:uncharacterized protein YlxW (UPF0749 family)